MDIIRDFLAQYGVQLLYTVITAIAGFVGVAIKNAYTRLANTKIKQDIVKKCVQAVEQLSRSANIHGAEKYCKAATYAQQLLAERGINISDTELQMLIEAALAELTGVFAGTAEGYAGAIGLDTE